MTQQQISDNMKIDKSTYCGYETGKRQPDVKKIKQITEILGVSADDLLEIRLSEEKKSAGISPDGKYRNFIAKLDKLTPAQVSRAEGFVDCMILENESAERASAQANEHLA